MFFFSGGGASTGACFSASFAAFANVSAPSEIVSRPCLTASSPTFTIAFSAFSTASPIASVISPAVSAATSAASSTAPTTPSLISASNFSSPSIFCKAFLAASSTS